MCIFLGCTKTVLPMFQNYFKHWYISNIKKYVLPIGIGKVRMKTPARAQRPPNA